MHRQVMIGSQEMTTLESSVAVWSFPTPEIGGLCVRLTMWISALIENALDGSQIN
ncbi:MAG: hypothetical protein ABJF88_00240 [Rhodothermales bacterium]